VIVPGRGSAVEFVIDGTSSELVWFGAHG